jgi:hypothetical protein
MHGQSLRYLGSPQAQCVREEEMFELHEPF